MALWTAFMLGLLGGVHCVGMCGPLMLALPVPPRGRSSFAIGRIVYQLGRVFTYCVLGLIFGSIGQSLVLAGFQRGASIVLGVALLAGLALSKKFLLAAPLVRLIGRLKGAMSDLLKRRSLGSLALLGTLNGLLPCGLVYAACAGAAAAGGVIGGLEYMAAFGAGTLPAMLAISLSGRVIPNVVRLRLRSAFPVAIALVGALLVLRGLSLGIPFVSPDLAVVGKCH